MSRKSLLVWHRRIALALAPLVLFQALTGLVLLFAPAATPAGDSPAIAPSHLAHQADAAMAGYHTFRLDYPENGAVEARLTGPAGAAAYVRLDPATARVLDQGPLWHFPWRVAQEWHYSLLAGACGSVVVAVEAIGLLLLAISGLAYWWPSGGRFRQALAIPARAPKRMKLRLWHRSTGVLASALLVLVAGTGLLLVWPLMAPSAPAAPRKDAALPLDQAAAIARAALPAQALRDIRIAPTGHATFHFAAQSANHWDLDTVTLEPDGTPTISRAANAPAPWMRLLPLHTGDALGMFGKLVIASLAAALVFLTISGTIAWNRARKGKRP